MAIDVVSRVPVAPHPALRTIPKPRTTLLDCTLRDGGYYNNWRFGKDLAVSLIRALNLAGVDIIEVGFKTPACHMGEEFDGLFRFCPESQLDFLADHQRSEYAFMINAREFISQGEADQGLIDSCINNTDASVFDWARIATHLQTFRQSIDQACLLKDKGYQVGLNLMGISLLSDEDIVDALYQIPPEVIDVFYFADSFGNLHGDDVIRYIALIDEVFEGKIGIHTHDNQGLAFSNVLTALDYGVDFVDSTVTGMGRGAGNLRTEQLLLAMHRDVKQLKPEELLDVIEKEFVPMQAKHGWGWDYTYMLSALENIHPIYCQNLRSNNHFSKEQVSCILNGIESSHRASYDKETMLNAIDRTVNGHRDQRQSMQISLPQYTPVTADEILIIAGGPSRNSLADELTEFIRQRQPVVIECNPTDRGFESVSRHYLQAILNWVRLRKALDQGPLTSPLVTGVAQVPMQYCGASALVSQIPCTISAERTEISDTGFMLASHVVGMFAVAVACLSSPHTIYLAGYDGFPDSRSTEQEEMDGFWGTIEDIFPGTILSLTDTNYELPIRSVYGYIQ